MNTSTKRIKLILLALVMLVIVGAGTSIFLYKKLRTIENPKATQEEQLQDTVREVGKVLLLPTDETPTFATVADPSKLKGQEFFAKAKVGDVVLIYAISRRAILWRPSTKQVIEISPLNVGSTTPTQ